MRASMLEGSAPGTRFQAVFPLFAALIAAISSMTGTAGTTASQAVQHHPRRVHAFQGEFADPSLLRVGRRYYAFATTGIGSHVPVLTSTDLHRWVRIARAGTLEGDRGTVDALPELASFAAWRQTRHNPGAGVWAPSVAKVGKRYVMAYAIKVLRSPHRRCIALAVSARPGGPYRNARSRPIVCSKDPEGAIDPEVFVSRAHRVYLLWKTSGIKHRKRTRLWSRRMSASGTRFRRGSRPHELLRTRQRWEGNVIENPALIRYAGRNYLFYSGNTYSTRRYATGYAICATPTGPCRRVTRRPLLHSGHGIAGPGGATPLVDRHGRLRLGYAAWDAGHVGYQPRERCSRTRYGCDHRRLHVALLRVRARGRLAVVRLR